MFSIKKYLVAVALLIASMIGAVQVQAAGQSVQDVLMKLMCNRNMF